MAEDTQALRQDIEQTRRNVGQDVDALADRIDPRRVMHRRADRARSQLRTLRHRVMGTTDDARHAVGSTAHQAASSVQGAASSVQEAGGRVAQAVQSAPEQAREQTRGAPLAAGVVAFAAGWLISAALPPTSKERQLAEQAKERAAGPIKEQVSEVAQELKENLREPAQEAVEHVKQSAGQAAEEIKEEGRGAAEDVRSETRQSADSVRQST